MHIKVFTTGGTIDKLYFDAQSEYAVGEPQIAEIFKTAGVSFTFDVEVLMQKDSLDITDDDRATIAARVAEDEAERILLTHGTDSMVMTAKAVDDALGPSPEKTVVLVGSLTPARFKATDAEFNVGFAAAAVQALSAGVYIAMNGRVFRPEAVTKNRARNRFEPATAPTQ